MSFKDFISKISGNTAATNEAYVQYEKVSTTPILNRDSGGGFITQNNGYYELNKKGKDIKNTEIDAFRHAYISAKTARDMGEGTAHLLGDLWEMTGKIGSIKESDAESKMDSWNNSQGRAIQRNLAGDATNDQLATAVYQAIKTENLIINNNDPRQYTGGSWRDNEYELGLGASQIWFKVEWTSEQINNYSYGSSGFSGFNFQLSNPIQEAIKHIGNARNHASPLAIDLDGDGIETTHLTEGNIFFDLFAKIKVTK